MAENEYQDAASGLLVAIAIPREKLDFVEKLLKAYHVEYKIMLSGIGSLDLLLTGAALWNLHKDAGSQPVAMLDAMAGTDRILTENE